MEETQKVFGECYVKFKQANQQSNFFTFENEPIS